MNHATYLVALWALEGALELPVEVIYQDAPVPLLEELPALRRDNRVRPAALSVLLPTIPTVASKSDLLLASARSSSHLNPQRTKKLPRVDMASHARKSSQNQDEFKSMGAKNKQRTETTDPGTKSSTQLGAKRLCWTIPPLTGGESTDPRLSLSLSPAMAIDICF